MSGETGVQTASPRPNVVAEDVPEQPDDSDTETIVNQSPTVEEHAEVDFEVSQIGTDESKKTIGEESTKLIEDEEMPTYTSFSEAEEKESVNVIPHEQVDKSDKHSVHSCDTEIDSENSSIESSHYYPENLRKNCNYDDDSELYSDEEDDEKLYDEEDELEEEEDKDEVKDENECVDDEVQLVEDESGDEDFESPIDGERASSDDYERRQNNVTKTEIEGKKSHSYQDLSDPKLLSEPKKDSLARRRVDANQVINPLKSASKSCKPGPKSFKQVNSKVKEYIENIKSISADERRKSEERKLKESQQSENQVLDQQQAVQKSARQEAREKQARLVQALHSEYIRANSEHDQRFADARPISIEKEGVHNTEIKVPILNDLNRGITIKPVWPAASLAKRDEVEIVLRKSDKEEKKVSGVPKAVNGASEQQDRMDYEDYMKPQDATSQLVHELAQERSKNAALRKQLEALRWREHESKKLTRDMAVQTETPKTSETATSISDWSEYPSMSVPSLDTSTQTSTNLSSKLSNTFLTSSRILETFTAISKQLKNDETATSFTPNAKKRKLDGEEEKEDDDMKCLVFKENENSAERSFLIAVQDRSNDGDQSTQINRKCGPYLIGNLEIMMSELNGTINVWGKEVSETNQNSANTTTASNVTLESSERRTLKARRTLNPRLVCSTEKKKSPYEHNRPGYRNSYACHSRRLECTSPPRHHSYYNRCGCHACRSSCHSHVPERRQHSCRCEHPRMLEDEPEHDYYDHGQEPDMHRERDYCFPNEERATCSASNAWNRMADTTLFNGKVDSGVHSDTLSNHEEESDYLQNLGFHEMNKIKKRRPAAKSFIDLLKSCGSDIRQTWSNRRNIPGHMPTSTSTSDFVQDANRSVYMPNDQDRRFKSDKNRARPSADTKSAKNLYPEPQGN